MSFNVVTACVRLKNLDDPVYPYPLLAVTLRSLKIDRPRRGHAWWIPVYKSHSWIEPRTPDVVIFRIAKASL